jgi:aminoglycoside 3-N-acetyltransferase
LRDWDSGACLVMPTHSYCYPTRRGDLTVFSVEGTPSAVGAVTEHFRKCDGVVRSWHPSHSVAALGSLAEDLCAGHERCNTPCGKGTPYARLLAQDCAVLMFGVTFENYTLFHTAEDEACVEYLYRDRSFYYVVDAGDHMRQSRTELLRSKKQNMDVERRFRCMNNWFENRGLLKRVRLGLGELSFVPYAAEANAGLVKELKGDPYFLTAKH